MAWHGVRIAIDLHLAPILDVLAMLALLLRVIFASDFKCPIKLL